mmetsp:Transcript_76365/g.169233  ORF Transcript_76365/g.169233 Transcript_76365/m.169233 type:complete len:280 (-) Transcript_76365:275-1114(-)
MGAAEPHRRPHHLNQIGNPAEPPGLRLRHLLRWQVRGRSIGQEQFCVHHTPRWQEARGEACGEQQRHLWRCFLRAVAILDVAVTASGVDLRELAPSRPRRNRHGGASPSTAAAGGAFPSTAAAIARAAAIIATGGRASLAWHRTPSQGLAGGSHAVHGDGFGALGRWRRRYAHRSNARRVANGLLRGRWGAHGLPTGSPHAQGHGSPADTPGPRNPEAPARGPGSDHARASHAELLHGSVGLASPATPGGERARDLGAAPRGTSGLKASRHGKGPRQDR